MNSANVVVEKRDCGQAGAVPVADALHDQKLYDRLVDAFSMRGFLPTPALPTGHDECFATFARFDRAGASRFVDMVIDQLHRYVDENVQYVEFMVSFSCASDREKFRNAIAGQENDGASSRRSRQAASPIVWRRRAPVSLPRSAGSAANWPASRRAHSRAVQ